MAKFVKVTEQPIAFEGPPDGIDALVASRTGGILAVSRELLTQRKALLGGIFEGRNIGWCRWRRPIEDLFQNPDSAVDRTRDHSVGSERQGAGHRHQAAAVVFGFQCDPAEVGAEDALNAVVDGEALVDHSEVAIDEVHEVEVFAHHLGEKLGGLFLEVVFEEITLQPALIFDHELIKFVEPEPLGHEPVVQGGCPWVCKHAVDLFFEDSWFYQGPAGGESQELVVRHAAPQEVRKARGKVIGREGFAALFMNGRVFREEEKLRGGEGGYERLLDGCNEVMRCREFPSEELHLRFQLIRFDRTPEGAGHEAGQHLDGIRIRIALLG